MAGVAIHYAVLLPTLEEMRRRGDGREQQIARADPEMFERAWTFSMPFVKSDDYTIYEYACHEGTEATGLILRGARTLEHEAVRPF